MSKQKTADVELKPMSRQEYPNEPAYPELIEEIKIPVPRQNPPPISRSSQPSSNIPAPASRFQPNSTPSNISAPTPWYQSNSTPSNIPAQTPQFRPNSWSPTSAPAPLFQPNTSASNPNITTPNIQPQPQYIGQMIQIKCSICGLMLQCSREVCFVACPSCRNLTAVKQMIPMVCVYCRKLSYFPSDAINIRCYCGAMYSNPYLRAS